MLRHVVEQHAEEGAFLWTQRDAAATAPNCKRRQLVRIDERVEAHIDGLRIAGEAGWCIALEQMEQRREKGELFAAAILALESGDMKRIEPLVAMAAEVEPAVRRGFLGAIAWCRPALLGGTVRRWDGSDDVFHAYLALSACSVHRAKPSPRIAARLMHDNALVSTRALRLVGELGKRDALPTCLDRLSNDRDLNIQFWAAWSSALLGDRGVSLDVLWTVAIDRGSNDRTALELMIRTSHPDERPRIAGMLGSDESLRLVKVVALGHVGDPAAVRWLIACLTDQALARAAGEAISMITGVDILSENLEAESPTDNPSGPTDDPAIEDIINDPDEGLPWPSHPRLTRWWDANHLRFPPGTSHLCGSPVTRDTCETVCDGGFQRQRRSACYELALRGHSVTLGNWKTSSVA